MKNIGRYQGTPCYECTRDELYDLFLKKDRDSSKNIYIVDGVMVKNNIIIGHYDGQRVKENYDGIPYFASMAKETFTVNKGFTEEFKVKPEETKKKSNKAEAKNETAVAVSDVSYEDLVNQEINFGNYSKIVDEFFALLEV